MSSVGRVAIVRHENPTVTASALVETLNKAHLGASVQATHTFGRQGSSRLGAKGGSAMGNAGEEEGGAMAGITDLASLQRAIGPWLALIVSFVGMMIAYLAPFLGLDRVSLWAIITPAIIIAASPLATPLLRAMILRKIDVNVLMMTAVMGALIIGDLTEAMAVLFLVLLADRVRRASLDYVARLLDTAGGRLLPQVARLADGREIALADVQVGHVILLRAGEQAPVDGVVIKGEAALDESALTGEACPVEKRTGSEVSGGTICQQGVIEYKCIAPADESNLCVIRDLVQDIACSRSPASETLDRFAAYYTPIVLLASFFMALAPEVGAAIRNGEGVAWQTGLYRGLELLVLACPCALAMAAPLPFLTTLASSASHAGVLFKSASALESLCRVQVLACDKTGTLTEGRFKVTGRQQLATSRTDFELTRKLAASLETQVAHRLSNAIVLDAVGCVTEAYYQARENRASSSGGLADVTKVKHIEGVGVEGVCTYQGNVYKVTVGNDFLLEDDDKEDEDLQAFISQHRGEAVLYIMVNGIAEAVLSLADSLRPEAPAMIEAMHKRGIETALLTGDSADVAAFIQSKVALTSVKARMKPKDKLVWIQERQAAAPPPSSSSSSADNGSHYFSLAVGSGKKGGEGGNRRDILVMVHEESGEVIQGTAAAAAAGAGQVDEDSSSTGGSGVDVLSHKRTLVAMVGDGINDGPSLTAADVSIAMGGGGTALAVQCADIILLSDNLARIPQAIKMSETIHAIVAQNIFLAVVLKFILLVVVFSGDGKLWEAVASDGLSLMAVILNGLRPLYLSKRIYT